MYIRAFALSSTAAVSLLLIAYRVAGQAPSALVSRGLDAPGSAVPGAAFVSSFVIIVVQLVLIAGLFMQRSRLLQAEKALRANERTLRGSYERIRALAARLIDAQEKARAAVARDLHDDVCQELVALSLGIDRLKHAPNGSESRPQLVKLQERTLAIIEGVRRLSHELHPASLRLLGLGPAVRAHCTELEKRHHARVLFRVDAELGQVDPDIAVCLFRMAQEALRNGLIHGGARHLSVSLDRFGDHINLGVTDDGSGFDVEAVMRKGAGLGLVSMEERVHAVGGELRVLSRRDQGTTVVVWVPACLPVGVQREDVTVQAYLPLSPGLAVKGSV